MGQQGGQGREDQGCPSSEVSMLRRLLEDYGRGCVREGRDIAEIFC